MLSSCSSNFACVGGKGALVANYPWDGTADRGTHYSRAPDDAAFLHLAHVYADAHATMHASHEFKGGVTNGAHWYPLWGGMQVPPALALSLSLPIAAGIAADQTCSSPLQKARVFTVW